MNQNIDAHQCQISIGSPTSQVADKEPGYEIQQQQQGVYPVKRRKRQVHALPDVEHQNQQMKQSHPWKDHGWLFQYSFKETVIHTGLAFAERVQNIILRQYVILTAFIAG